MKLLILNLLAALVFNVAASAKPSDHNDATDALVEHRASDDIMTAGEYTFPYYGGLRGNYIQLKDGKVKRIIPKKDPESATKKPSAPAALSAAGPGPGSGPKGTEALDFQDDFNRIQEAAAHLVAIQEKAKRKGVFSAEDNEIYAANLMELGQAAQSLAALQQSGQIIDFSILLRPHNTAPVPPNAPPKTPPKEEGTTENSVVVEPTVEEQKVDEITEQQISEADLLPPNNEDSFEDVNDSVAVSLPKKDAAVAESKPVGLSIAGEGGVASSKPNAVALSGRNGLAVSAPKATAIAGVTPEEVAAFSISLPSRDNLVIKSWPSLTARLPSSASASSLTYDDYDYSDPLSVRPKMGHAPLTRAADKSRPKPMIATANAADAIVRMWRTAIAEDYAAASDVRGRHIDQDVHKPVKVSSKGVVRARNPRVSSKFY